MNLNQEKRLIYIGIALVVVGLVSLAVHVLKSPSRSDQPHSISMEFEGTEVRLNKVGHQAPQDELDQRRAMYGRALEKARLRNIERKAQAKTTILKEDGKNTPKAKKETEEEKKKKAEEEKKKKEEEKETADQAPDEATEEDPDANDDDLQADENNQAAPPFVVAGQPKTDSDLPPGVSDWLDRFITTPTKKLLTEFVQLHEMGEVSDAVYYAVIDELLAKTNAPRLNEFGVYALELARSVRSFDRLVQLTHGQALTTQIAEMSRHALESFGHMGGLGVLREVIASTTDINSIIESTRLVRQILKRTIQLNQRENNNRFQTQSVQVAGARNLFRLIPVLEQTQSESNDPSVNAALQQTLQELQQAQNQLPLELGAISDLPVNALNESSF
ncbi:MAG: hypothetical protein R2827_09340 [Bdellovibrionales bacterium]